MDTNVLALKNLYVAFGGDLATVVGINTNAGMINALAALVSGGGAATLPTVTAEDNGKVLTVVDGEWEAAATSAGEG